MIKQPVQSLTLMALINNYYDASKAPISQDALISLEVTEKFKYKLVFWIW